jgi:GT2 family glycosyltransferase
MSTQISIVIVNYNVKDLLDNCIESIKKSNFDGDYEIIVVDNNSTDNSVEFLKPKHPDVNFIANQENVGFSKANNQGFDVSSGKYILILNPDTLIEPDTLQKMYDLLESDNEIGAAGCKVLNEDGSFQQACRRSFPTPWNSFCKLFGLQKMFPKSKLFSSYNLSYLDINEQYEVEALIGAFIFTRKKVLDAIGGFDESFFMYGEDLDLCFKIKKNDWKILYSPITSIKHLKGESTKRSNIDEVKHFYNAMEIYIKKNYKYSNLFIGFLKFGIKIRSSIAYLSKEKRNFLYIFIDILILSISFLLANKLRFDEFTGHPIENFWFYLIIMNFINIVSNFSFGSYFENNYSLRRLFQSTLGFGILTGFVTYLFQEFDLSRKVLLFSGLIYFTFGLIIRILIDRFNSAKNSKNILIYGDENLSNQIFNYLKQKLNKYSNISLFSNENNLEKYISENKINEIIISGKLHFLKLENELKKSTIDEVSILPADNFNDFQTNILLENTFGTAAQEEFKLRYPRYRIFKRVSDIILSIFFLSFGLPLLNLIGKHHKSPIKLMMKVLIGSISFVGLKSPKVTDNFKAGFLNLSDLSGGESDITINNLNQYYLRNYSVGLDLEIFFKSFYKKGK